MTEREKMIAVIKQAFEEEGRMLKEQAKRVFSGEIKKASQGLPPLDEFIADALIAKGYGNIDKTVEEAYAFTLELNDKIKAAEHHAEVAERAFDNTIKAFHETLSALFPDTKVDLDKWKKDNLANAEKELEEEGNAI